jgi:hypothetical protein
MEMANTRERDMDVERGHPPARLRVVQKMNGNVKKTTIKMGNVGIRTEEQLSHVTKGSIRREDRDGR